MSACPLEVFKCLSTLSFFFSNTPHLLFSWLFSPLENQSIPPALYCIYSNHHSVFGEHTPFLNPPTTAWKCNKRYEEKNLGEFCAQLNSQDVEWCLAIVCEQSLFVERMGEWMIRPQFLSWFPTKQVVFLPSLHQSLSFWWHTEISFWGDQIHTQSSSKRQPKSDVLWNRRQAEIQN